jgi:hypothetical protein
MRISVITVARRQAQPQLTLVAPGTNPSANAGTTQTDPWSQLIQDDLSASCNGSNTAFTLSQTPKAFLGVVWNTKFHVTDFTQTGTSLTTNFLDAGGNATAPLAGDKLYALYFA